jgi:hypothetical protein
VQHHPQSNKPAPGVIAPAAPPATQQIPQGWPKIRPIQIRPFHP